MQMRRRDAGQEGGWGCGPEQLEATVPCALLTVDVSQWRGIQQSIPFSSMSWFMYPQFLLNHGGDNPNYSLVVELLGTSKNRRFMRHSIKAEQLSKLQSTTHVAHAWS